MRASALAPASAPASADGAARERALVRAAQRGSVPAFEDLVRLHGDMLLRFLVLRLGNEADARDALQETLTSAWAGLRSLRDPQSLRAWLLTLAARHAGSMVSRSRRQATLATVPAPHGDRDGAIDLQSALDALPPDRRDVVLLRYLVGLSETETAAALGISVGTVKSRAARARQAIATHLQIREEHE